MMNTNTKSTLPTILVIVGITGDLSKRYLLPAIAKISKAGLLPDKFKVIGITRQNRSIKDVLSEDFYNEGKNFVEVWNMDLSDESVYPELLQKLSDIEKANGETTQKLFYLSVPPQAALPVVEFLGEAGCGNDQTVKLLLEKPFGIDEESASELITNMHTHFNEENLYRIDHYLAKEMVQNLVVFRSGNSLFKRTWNKDFIESIEIIASEAIDIEGRAGLYEQTGALRDVVQSHLMQLAALVLMDIPDEIKWHDVPKQRLDALLSLHIPEHIVTQASRGQYKGYRDDVKNQKSMVETYVRLLLSSKNPKWEGVPIFITAGKALKDRCTEIRITYKKDEAGEANTLTLRIQPNEGVELDLWAKQPGFEREMRKLPLQSAYTSEVGELPNAYERVFIDAIRSDRSLFTTSDEVLASWRILSPVQKYWSMQKTDLIFYEKGSSSGSVI